MSLSLHGKRCARRVLIDDDDCIAALFLWADYQPMGVGVD